MHYSINKIMKEHSQLSTKRFELYTLMELQKII